MSRTGHDARFANQFSEFDLAANIPVSYVEVGLGAKHPILSLDDIIKTLDKENKLQDIMMQGNSAETFKHFWSNWRQLQPTHGIFQHHNTHLGQCIPVAVHCDEGTTLKKKLDGDPTPAPGWQRYQKEKGYTRDSWMQHVGELLDQPTIVVGDVGEGLYWKEIEKQTLVESHQSFGQSID